MRWSLEQLNAYAARQHKAASRPAAGVAVDPISMTRSYRIAVAVAGSRCTVGWIWPQRSLLARQTLSSSPKAASCLSSARPAQASFHPSNSHCTLGLRGLGTRFTRSERLRSSINYANLLCEIYHQLKHK